MNIAIDIDGCITAYPQVFSTLLELLAFGTYSTIITNRTPGTEKEIAQELETYGIFEEDYDKIVITAEKAKYIIENNIELLIENTDEYFQNLPASVCVLKVREDGNFNFHTGKWIYGDKTGENIDDLPVHIKSIFK